MTKTRKKHLINFTEISREITGEPDIIRANQIPPKFRQVIDECVESVKIIISKYKYEKFK